MKKLFMAAIVALFAVACEGTGDNDRLEDSRGTFISEEITATYEYAADFYMLEFGVYSHLLIFSNIEVTGIEDMEGIYLKDGEHADIFMTSYLSESKDIETCQISYLSEIEEFKSLPCWMAIEAVGAEGTADIEEPNILYDLFNDPYQEAGQPGIFVEKNGETYKVAIEGVSLYNDCTRKYIKGTLKYEGPIRMIDASEYYDNEEFALRQFIRK